MPAVSEKQRRFMGMELGRKRKGEATETGMSEESLRDFARKGKRSKRRHKRKTRK
jgi:hypothetical protein